MKKTFNEDLVLAYMENGDEDIFIEIINSEDVKRYVNFACRQKLRNAPTTIYSQEDLLNIAYLTIWQSIHKYRFICPCCGKAAKTQSAYKIHMIAKHEEYQEPKVSINRYLKFNLGAYLQNEIKREYSLERRSNVMTVNLYSPLEEDSLDDRSRASNDNIESAIVSEDIVEGEVVFREVVEMAIEQFDDLSKEIFNYIYIEKMKQRDIAEIFYNQGRYSSEQSAAVIVSRVIKKKISPCLIKYYPELN